MLPISIRDNMNMDKFRNTPTEITSYVEIIKKRLYFAVTRSRTCTKLKNTIDAFYFSIDKELIYENYYCDFGPLNLSCVYKYCCKLNKFLQYAKGIKTVIHYTCSHPDKKANATCLMGIFCVIFLKIDPKDVWKKFQALGPFKPYLDASQCPCGFTLNIVDCMQAISKALTFNFFNFDDFNVAEYDLHDKLQYGDMNWLVPRKFLAFIGPADNRTAHPPEFYIKYFLKNDVKTVIRLNSIIYDSNAFTQVGIEHFDLIFPDGTTPPKDILLKFLHIAELAPAAIAVHCKAGLGRTGSLIGAYLIKHYRMTAKEAIAWMRICRPGSVIGQQQIWLDKIESWLWRIGSHYRVRKFGEGDKIPCHRFGIYSKQWPVEREKIISEARRRIQGTFTKSQLDKISKNKFSASVGSVLCKDGGSRNLKNLFLQNNNSYKSISRLLTSVHGKRSREPLQNVSVYSVEPVSNFKGLIGETAKKLVCIDSDRKQPRSKNGILESSKSLMGHQGIKRIQSLKNQITQGDKLNEIKATRCNNRIL